MFYHRSCWFGFFSVKRVASYCRISEIPVLDFSSKVPLTTVRSRFSADKQHKLMYSRTSCSSSALKRLLTVVRGHFGRKTRTVSITFTHTFHHITANKMCSYESCLLWAWLLFRVTYFGFLCIIDCLCKLPRFAMALLDTYKFAIRLPPVLL